jgi:hypothetical protein
MKRLNWFEQLLVALLLFCDMTYAMAEVRESRLPGEAAQLLPILDNEITNYWPDLSPRAFPAGVIDQESNWKTKATLRTSREWGCGLGQFTVAYNADGSVRFDALAETARLDKSLKDWNWKDCSNYQFQLRGVVLKLKVNERSCGALLTGNLNIKACGSAMNNGGAGSVNKRIRFCRADPDCNPREWFNNLERMCPQSNVKVAGYGESFCDINSKYPGRVFARLPKFRGVWPDDEKFQIPTPK